MKLLKDEIFESILSVARQEFISKGYKNTSMRDIAQKANVGLSNIYNYFKNKDEIYRAILNPAKNGIFTFITQQHTEDNFDFSHIIPYGHNENTIIYYIELIEKYKEEYRLLLYCSEGSLENPVQIDPVNQTILTPRPKISLTLLTKIKMTLLKCMPT
ncbi:TetR/AcrR family transcriptional regulator [Parabacteroides sp. 52]|uniref:TetR/AcrR family transcriptional regulator n=1 Tax=unclassified Parabacteroides TaxID=2649774 RepID=UPI0013D78A11|nr:MULTISPECIES: helix-turn-helix domain-containing protein [unclassified Parabacteroides]NDV56415.1 TetR/AcrR family transcriptional regulator [Parabacteroides sp. 52]